MSDIGDKINAQDNLATATPYLVVLQSLKCVGVVDENYFYGDRDSHEIRHEKASEESDETLPILYKYEDVNWFFTQEAAKAHMQANHYHYDKPRTYIKHCWRNPEMKKVFEILGAHPQ